jgi:regulator of nucleoside diphosphate kinase
MSTLDFRNPSFTLGPEPRGPRSLVRQAPIQIAVGDMKRLRGVVERHAGGVQDAAAEMLESELDRALVVPRNGLPRDVVTMHSRVLFEDVDTGERRELVLVYPEEADVQRSWISVLAPVGTALLGLSAGQSISWPVPGGRTRTIRVVSVVYQPRVGADRLLSEASGPNPEGS